MHSHPSRDVNPQDLLGAAFQPLVSLAVAVILYDSGMSLNLHKLHGHTRRIGARQPGHGVVAPYTGGEILFEAKLTRYEVSQRYAGGARICTQPVSGSGPADGNLLFLVRADGKLVPVTRNGPPEPQPGDTMVLLGLTANVS